MSAVQLNIFVEGRSVDAVVYDRLVTAAAPGLARRVIRADELTAPGGTGGKTVLLTFFDHLASVGELLAPGHHVVLFCLDKDLDDLDGTLRNNDHVIYTHTYDVEGLVAREADLRTCAANALSLTEAEAAFLGPPGVWCRNAAARWGEWIALCLCSRSLGVARANYRALSQVNSPLHTAADKASVARVLADIATAAGKTAASVRARYRRRLQLVRQRQLDGLIDTWFKGKWYLNVLVSELMTAFPDRAPKPNELRASLLTAILADANYSATWGEPVRIRIATLTALL